MATWVGVVAETGGRSDFWQVAARLDVTKVEVTRVDVTSAGAMAAHVLIDCQSEYDRVMEVARRLSSALGTTAIGFVAQTVSDVHQLHTFRSGELVRQLDYNRDGGGWAGVTGVPQAWERAYFFGADDQIGDDASGDDARRYQAAKRSGDAMAILALLHPSSTEPMARVCRFFGLDPSSPNARLQQPSLWSRLIRLTSSLGT